MIKTFLTTQNYIKIKKTRFKQILNNNLRK